MILKAKQPAPEVSGLHVTIAEDSYLIIVVMDIVKLSGMELRQ
jgi:hypothetical protein